MVSLNERTRQSWLPLFVLGVGMSMIIIDATIVNVAVPSIMADLSLSATDVEWVNSIYSLTFAALLVPLSRTGDARGRRRMFALGLVVFLVASVLAAMAGSGALLIGARVLQGVGASMVVPMTLAIINSLYVGPRRTIAFAVWGSIIGGMAALGPLLGGWLVTDHGWRWAFWVNLPIGLLVLLGTLKVPESRDPDARGWDVPGVLLSVVGTSALVFGLIEGQRYGWFAPAEGHTISPIPFAFALAVLALTAFALVERARARAGRPVILHLSLLAIPSFRYGCLTAMIVTLGEFGMILVLPLFLQSAMAFTAFEAGLVIASLALGTFLAGGVVPKLRLTPRLIVRLGLALEAVGAIAVGLSVSPSLGHWTLVPWLVLYGVGVGFASAQLPNLTLAQVPPQQSGVASGLQSAIRQLGAAIGIAVLGSVLVTGLGSAMAERLPADPALGKAVRDSAGAAVAMIKDPARHSAAVAAAADATRRVTVFTGIVLFAGVGVTLLLPDTGEGRREEE
ncbi:Antiseptic resistance protein [Nonomuraea coxensis DSM 45129]|uniref:Antiseptic resistance protein n=1 Tax=Nonomuraea coxensis DSM 45129 TaxID=1122611 RepID=A0ABX8U8T8_9ACTN|nr:DHA2 family efflux MFS transporter permease subunit [Nonomuraea coxensis]QYC43351.1 Antiseptic resistance protein [Nonomuraea coxensis DSM 45129]